VGVCPPGLCGFHGCGYAAVDEGDVIVPADRIRTHIQTERIYDNYYNSILKEIDMITALVQFKLPQPISREKAREIFSGTAPKYRKIHGLIRKYYILSQDGGTAGGVYLWNSQEDAERFYTDEWKKFILDKYDALPSVIYFECPVIVDNTTDEITADH